MNLQKKIELKNLITKCKEAEASFLILNELNYGRLQIGYTHLLVAREYFEDVYDFQYSR